MYRTACGTCAQRRGGARSGTARATRGSAGPTRPDGTPSRGGSAASEAAASVTRSDVMSWSVTIPTLQPRHHDPRTLQSRASRPPSVTRSRGVVRTWSLSVTTVTTVTTVTAIGTHVEPLWLETKRRTRRVDLETDETVETVEADETVETGARAGARSEWRERWAVGGGRWHWWGTLGGGRGERPSLGSP